MDTIHDVPLGGDAIVEPAAKVEPKAKPKPAAPKPKVKAKPKPKGAAIAKAGPAEPVIPHIPMACDLRGDGKAMLRYDTIRNKLAAHCGFPHHGRLCRIQRSLDTKDTNPAGIHFATE